MNSKMNQEIEITKEEVQSNNVVAVLTAEEALAKLEELCYKHDWYYDYSDDHWVWTRGNTQYKEIQLWINKCYNLGVHAEVVKEVISKYAPKE